MKLFGKIYGFYGRVSLLLTPLQLAWCTYLTHLLTARQPKQLTEGKELPRSSDFYLSTHLNTLYFFAILKFKCLKLHMKWKLGLGEGLDVNEMECTLKPILFLS